MTQCGAVFSLVGAIVISVTTNQATLIAVEEKVLSIDSFEYGMNSAPRILVRFAFIMLQLLAAFVLRRTPLQVSTTHRQSDFPPLSSLSLSLSLN